MWGGVTWHPHKAKQRKCGWKWLTLFGSTMPRLPHLPLKPAQGGGSKAMWTCSLPCGVWVTCTQEGVVIHHHLLDQIGWLTTIVKSTTELVSGCHVFPSFSKKNHLNHLFFYHAIFIMWVKCKIMTPKMFKVCLGISSDTMYVGIPLGLARARYLL